MSEELRILKIATCPSLSGRSTLTYHVGCKNDGTLYIQIYQNSGSGVFSKEWIPIMDPLMASGDKPLTAGMLRELFKGRSVNTCGFVIAALIHEGLLKVADESKRTYERIDPTKYKAEIQALIDAGTTMYETPAPDKEKATKAKMDTPLDKGKAKKEKKTANADTADGES